MKSTIDIFRITKADEANRFLYLGYGILFRI